MYVIYLSFVSKVSDPKFGGIYMTLLSTFANVSLAITKTGSLWLVDVLTFKQCTVNSQNYCEASTSIKVINDKTNSVFYLKKIVDYKRYILSLCKYHFLIHN